MILSYLNEGKEEKAIKVLYLDVFPKIKQYIKSNKGNKEQAEDIFHDSILKLIIKVRNKEISNDTDIKAYLFTISKNLWIDRARREKKLQFVEQISEEKSTDELSEDSDKTKAMEEALVSIGEKCKELLILTFYLNHSLKDAAKKLGISNEEVAKTNQYRCKKKLFEAIRSNNKFKLLIR